jgi:hypothetical protein
MQYHSRSSSGSNHVVASCKKFRKNVKVAEHYKSRTSTYKSAGDTLFSIQIILKINKAGNVHVT